MAGDLGKIAAIKVVSQLQYKENLVLQAVLFTLLQSLIAFVQTALVSRWSESP